MNISTIYCVCYCTLLIGCTSIDDEKVEDTTTYGQIKVIDSAANVPSYRVVHFVSEAISERQLQRIMEVSGFQLRQIIRNDSTAQQRLFFEIINTEQLDSMTFNRRLKEIKNLPFINDARFEAVARPFDK